jgi:hypothetical protein
MIKASESDNCLIFDAWRHRCEARFYNEKSSCRERNWLNMRLFSDSHQPLATWPAALQLIFRKTC